MITKVPKMNRVWAMPNSCTFDIPDIRALVKTYLAKSTVSIDPFARNKRWATHTNDLNPETAAEFHLEALEFLHLLKSRCVTPDLVLFDPPYSRRQVQEVYQGIGRAYGMQDSQYHTTNWRAERDLITEMLSPGGYVLSFGWNSAGMNWARGYEIEEILLVCHGGAANDTIITVERKIESTQMQLIA